jgi:hypothetical protein
MIKNTLYGALFCAAIAFFAVSPMTVNAQDQMNEDNPAIDRSAIPDSGDSVNDFVPKGWKLEADVKGDLNGEDKPAESDGTMTDRNRALVLVFADKDGVLTKAAVTDKLLQCTSCGGAFYGVSDAPAEVTIEKGVLVVNQDHGSRWVTDVTFRFRFDEQPNMFILIGFDYAGRDRATGEVSTESTNYLTGKRITTIGKGKRETTKTTVVKKMRYSIEEVSAENFEAEATTRLGLD